MPATSQPTKPSPTVTSIFVLNPDLPMAQPVGLDSNRAIAAYFITAPPTRLHRAIEARNARGWLCDSRLQFEYSSMP
jgi:hypothetical protein